MSNPDAMLVSEEYFNILADRINCTSKNYNQHVINVQVNDTMFMQLEFNRNHETFIINVIKGLVADNSDVFDPEQLPETWGEFPALFIVDVLAMARQYLSDVGGTYDKVKAYELRTSCTFDDYFRNKTGLHLAFESMPKYISTNN